MASSCTHFPQSTMSSPRRCDLAYKDAGVECVTWRYITDGVAVRPVPRRRVAWPPDLAQLRLCLLQSLPDWPIDVYSPVLLYVGSCPGCSIRQSAPCVFRIDVTIPSTFGLPVAAPPLCLTHSPFKSHLPYLCAECERLCIGCGSWLLDTKDTGHRCFHCKAPVCADCGMFKSNYVLIGHIAVCPGCAVLPSLPK